jgi:hypothetical protein
MCEKNRKNWIGLGEKGITLKTIAKSACLAADQKKTKYANSKPRKISNSSDKIRIFFIFNSACFFPLSFWPADSCEK